MGEKLRRIRERKGMYQSELAEKLGVQQRDVSYWETGKRLPSVLMLRKIAKILGCTMEDLVYDDLGENMKQFREAKNLSIEELAEMVGVNQDDIICWETGKQVPSVRLIKRIAIVLGCSVNALI